MKLSPNAPEHRSTKISRALISVSDKSGIVDLSRTLINKFGVSITATDGCLAALQDAELTAESVEDCTGSPQILGGRVKTLHPKIHGGLLADTSLAEHRCDVTEQGITLIDLLIVNLYPFERIVRSMATKNECIEGIDIGGVALLRAAAKNHQRLTVVSEPKDYSTIIDELTENQGTISYATRLRLAAKAFAHVARYDLAIADWYAEQAGISNHSHSDSEIEAKTQTQGCVITKATDGAGLNVIASDGKPLRYGENPQQRAAVYATGGAGAVRSEVIQGKELSYNNLLDADAAIRIVAEHTNSHDHVAAIIKHGNPSGVARAATATSAYTNAVDCDPMSAFGGIVALNSVIDAQTATCIAKKFFEVIIAPDITSDARKILARKDKMRVLLINEFPNPEDLALRIRSICGGILVQEADRKLAPYADAQVVSHRQPTPAETDAMYFAMRVCKHATSNAIVIADDSATLGIGAGQMSRVDAAKIAISKSEHKSNASVIAAASDAFFPKPDAVSLLAEAGVTAIIHPGGSKQDQQVIDVANSAGLAVIATGVRHFYH